MELFSDINVMNRALDATVLKHTVISNNISNVDTPGYKRQDVEFERLLAQEINKKGINNLNETELKPRVYEDKSGYSYRLDGSNVDIDTEMAEEAKVVARYNVLTVRAAAQLNRFKTILQTLK
ncbi:flagellar basal body rod protein FlgB [Sporanaerobium hydrogeniformans]|uniref:Flagellar basal body rod protein FlgB n=1 Tax=Sporanaerobium hydrogeniformans TaxID=3072179 RepID=A0AC61DGB9_9FIRM|nr:flagellar basal body rod protein FlgB [Sporanaerobium hydrogeniformans]PHV71736.1 flagellar basal body rod protein FlgB [Sporanaerobium hydrogeniformans]